MSLEIKHACTKCKSTKTRRTGETPGALHRKCMDCGNKDKTVRFPSSVVKAIILHDDMVILNLS